MKKLLLIFTALIVAGIVNAQSNKEEIDYIQATFGMNKKALVADFMKLDASKADAFWKLYDEYEVKRKDLGKQRFDLMEQYANNYEGMPGEVADKWMADVIKLSNSTDKLLQEYYSKVKKVTDPVTALKFYHVESYLLSSFRAEVTSELPWVKGKVK
jgi:hypothetical protein